MAEIKNDTPVVVPEAKGNEYLELTKKGVLIGAASAAGGLMVYGTCYAVKKAYEVGKQILGNMKEKRAARKAAKKSSKEDKGGEA